MARARNAVPPAAAPAIVGVDVEDWGGAEEPRRVELDLEVCVEVENVEETVMMS
jgi:hypothetical protein